MTEQEFMLWGALWIQKGSLDGDIEHLCYENFKPVMFPTRRECREWIQRTYGYIKTSKDLRSYPYGWRLPVPVKLQITYKL